MTALVADAVIDRLHAWGVHRIFGYPGDGIDPILGALRRAAGDPEYVGARHEEGAALMATGHAKYTGGVGCCLATHGPGAVHLLNGLYDAKLDVARSSPSSASSSAARSAAPTSRSSIRPCSSRTCARPTRHGDRPRAGRARLDRAIRTAIAQRRRPP